MMMLNRDNKLSAYFVDLHLHSVLSPCAGLEMGAVEIVRKVNSEGISIIAVTDHNHVANFRALRDAAIESAEPLLVLPGMEVQSMEDIHVVVIFPDEDRAYEYKDWLWQKMPDIKNKEERFGYQLIIDKDGNILDQEEVLLIQGAMRTVDEISSYALKMGCIVIMAHMDRPSFSYEAVLGPLPGEFQCSAIEISPLVIGSSISKWSEKYSDRTIIRSSDAHKIDQISRYRCSSMKLGGLSFDEVFLALKRENGREVLYP
ncbi:MAG: histidinol-phosphatase [Synergistaceae bacterium]|nr:histidinol-phosphatase [Synergistaceae bacterium]